MESFFFWGPQSRAKIGCKLMSEITRKLLILKWWARQDSNL